VASVSPSQLPIVNIAAYKFAELQGLPELRERLKIQCRLLELKGSILLSPEGINLFIAGEEPAVESLLATVRAIPGLENLNEKRSESDDQPFNRMLVKIKQEIIAFGIEGINPSRYTSPKVTAKELKRWLDEGRSFTLLDTRNTYEVKLGTFAGAVTLPLRHFRKFPEAVDALPEELKQVPVVSFCTGGIRCEKAAPFLEMSGFREVYQLEGGILKYFEECGGAHWEGECFVFDKRVGVDPALRETGSQLCFACQQPLTTAELLDPRYIYEVSCPYCHERNTPNSLVGDK
jgi:predicted sulfurtransferase